MSCADTSPVWRAAQQQRLVNEAMCPAHPLFQKMLDAAFKHAKRMSPEERERRDLDWQNERVRDAFAVLRGEMEATEE